MNARSIKTAIVAAPLFALLCLGTTSASAPARDLAHDGPPPPVVTDVIRRALRCPKRVAIRETRGTYAVTHTLLDVGADMRDLWWEAPGDGHPVREAIRHGAGGRQRRGGDKGDVL